MTLKIVGAGFGRTGTLSLKVALEHLGLGPCHHMNEVRRNPSQLATWERAVATGSADWHEAFAGYTAQVDWPGAAYWSDIHCAFPDAKVILTVRDPMSWYESIQATIVRSVTVGRTEGIDAETRAFCEMVYQTTYRRLFDGRMEDRAYMLEAFDRHVATVQATIPADQLLTLDVRDGWQPLCDFLGVGVPDVAFPARNSTDEYLKEKPHLKR